MAILDLMTRVWGLNRSEILQKYSHRVNKPNQVKTDALKLQKQPFEAQKVTKNQIFPIFWGFETPSQYQYGQSVNMTLNFGLMHFLNLDHGSGQVCRISPQVAVKL